MSGAEFKDWMKANRVTIADVASATKLSANAIYAFRRGDSVHPATVQLLTWFVERFERVNRKYQAVS